MVCPVCNKFVVSFWQTQSIFPQVSGRPFVLDSEDDHFSLSLFQPAIRSSVGYIFHLLLTSSLTSCCPVKNCVLFPQICCKNVLTINSILFKIH